VQTSILPPHTRLRAGGEADPFRRSVNMTLSAIAGFAACVALVMLVAGPLVMDLLFGGDFEYGRGGLVLVSIGVGLYLAAATLNQALLAHGRAPLAATCWVTSAVGFVVFLLVVNFDDPVLQVEVAFAGAATCLCAALYASYRHSHLSLPRG
jgi:O-antigen/teichoic acid export membrane protein